MMVKSVTPLVGFRVKLKFTNGVSKVVDLADHLHGRLFSKLRSPREFVKVMVSEGGGIEWPNGADICPDVLYYDGPPPWARRFSPAHR